MIVLKIIGCILLALLILIILALLLKIGFEVEYSAENTSVVLKILFIKIPVYPVKKSEKKTKDGKDSKKADKKSTKSEAACEKTDIPENSKEEEAEFQDDINTEIPAVQTVEKNESTHSSKTSSKKDSGIKDLLTTLYNAEGIDGLMLITRRTVDYLGTFFSGLLHWIVVNEFYLDVSCTKDDAAATAVYYGEVCSALYPMLGSLVSKCKVRKYDINIYPDYIARFSSASFILKFYFIPIVLVGHILALIFKLLFKVVLQLAVKIFLYLKGNKNTGNNNIKSTEKSEVTNE